MSKREASSELTRDNWEEDLEPEDAGSFQPASQEALKDRVIRKAVRRGTENSVKVTKSAFLGFGGFGKTASIPNFDFMSKTTPLVINGNAPVSVEGNTEKSKEPTGEQCSNSSAEYYKQLKCLNECFQQWIQKHLDKSPYCDFTPVCRDYERHLKEITNKFPLLTRNNGRTLDSDRPAETVTTSSETSVLKTISDPKESPFGVTPAKDVVAAKPFSFFDSGAPKAAEPTAVTFSFVAAKNSTDKEDDCVVEEEDTTPPKNEFTLVQEKDSIFSKRCKLFYEKDMSYVDKGVGVLYLKKLDANTQLLVRADTNLGNVLLNIILSKSFPVQRTGKNNVSIVCIPNPPVDGHGKNDPVRMLIRVKTGADADELYSALVQHAT